MLKKNNDGNQLNEREQNIVNLINQLSEYANDENSTQEAIEGILGKIQANTNESIKEQMDIANQLSNRKKMDFPVNDVSREFNESIEKQKKRMFEEMTSNIEPQEPQHLIFTRIREVKQPCKAHPTDAGIDFYVPDEKAWDDEFKNKVIEMSRNPVPPPVLLEDDGSASDDSTKSLELVDFVPGYETIGGDHMPMSIIVRPGGHVAIPSGIKTIIPQGLGMMMVNKSGVATKMKLDHSACLIDSEYRDELIFCFFNHSIEPIQIMPGMKITQGLIVPIINLNIQEVLNCVYDDLGKDNNRGGGFGSSGTN